MPFEIKDIILVVILLAAFPIIVKVEDGIKWCARKIIKIANRVK